MKGLRDNSSFPTENPTCTEARRSGFAPPQEKQ
jgi:hypothetical protein